jgi:hypothetical protein
VNKRTEIGSGDLGSVTPFFCACSLSSREKLPQWKKGDGRGTCLCPHLLHFRDILLVFIFLHYSALSLTRDYQICQRKKNGNIFHLDTIKYSLYGFGYALMCGLNRSKKLKTKLRGLGPRANYTERAIAVCMRS